MKGYGHHEETYVTDGGKRKIRTILLTRLHCDVTWTESISTDR